MGFEYCALGCDGFKDVSVPQRDAAWKLQRSMQDEEKHRERRQLNLPQQEEEEIQAFHPSCWFPGDQHDVSRSREMNFHSL